MYKCVWYNIGSRSRKDKEDIVVNIQIKDGKDTKENTSKTFVNYLV